jgi:RHS repeat-associated protein
VINPSGLSIDQVISTGAPEPVFHVQGTVGGGSFTAADVSSAPVTTTGNNELLLAFVTAVPLQPATSVSINSVSGASLTWTLVQRSNLHGGTAEVWRAFAPSVLTSVSITAEVRNIPGSSVDMSLTVVSFMGADATGSNGSGAIGATATASTASAMLTTTRNNSLLFAVGADETTSTTVSPGPKQTVLNQFTCVPCNTDTGWAQQLNTTVPASGTSVTLNDTQPTNQLDFAAVEVLPATSPATAPLITSLSTVAGSPGGTLTLSGVNFGSAQGSSIVTFNGTTATATSWSPTSIAVTIPNGASTGNVVVTVGGQASNGLRFIIANASGLAIDQTSFTLYSAVNGSMATPLSTSSGNEVLLALVATAPNGSFGGPIASPFQGAGLTWVRVEIANTQSGTAEVWRAFSPYVLNNASVRYFPARATDVLITVIALLGADTSGTNGSGAIGALATANSASGAPTATLTSTRANSFVFGAGDDPTNAATNVARTPGPNQVILNQSVVNQCIGGVCQPISNTLWTQQVLGSIAAAGTNVTVNDTAPATDSYNLSIVEVLPSPNPLAITAAASPAANAAGWNNTNVTVTYTCTGGLAPVSCPGQTTVSTEGANQVITATATDAGGHSASASVKLNIDKTAPTLSITSPTNGTVVTTASAPVTGSVADSLSGVAAVTCDGAAATVQSGSFSCAVTLNPGSNSINVQATDVAGNGTPQSVSETFSVPSITGFTPASAPTGTVVTISGSNFAPNGLTPLVTLSQQGGGTIAAPLTSASASSISFIIPAGAATGPLTVTTGGSSAVSVSALAVVAHTSYTLAVGPSSATVQQGSSVAYAVSLGSNNGFSQLANLSVAGLPVGVTASFSPALITNGQISILTVTAPAGQPVGNSTLTVSASATVEGIASAQTANVGLAVQPATTSLIGRTVESDTIETPIPGITISFLGKDDAGNPTGCSGQTVSDAGGNFAFVNLPTACTGRQLVRYNGLTASDGETYASVNLFYTLNAGQITGPELVHLPAISNAETKMVQQNASTDQTFTFSSIPGIVVTVYAGTTFTLVDGTQPNPFPLSVVNVPVDRLPDVPIDGAGIIRGYVIAFQPSDTTLSQPMAVVYPNSLNTPPGVNMELDMLDPVAGTFVKYGTGTVSGNGTVINPDPDPAHPGHLFGISRFDWEGPLPPGPNGSNPCPAPPCSQGGDPVDLSSGLFTFTKTDIAFGGARGTVSIDRTYRTLSGSAGPFGVGTNHSFGYVLGLENLAQGSIALIVPDGNQFPFTAQADGSYTNTTTPSLLGAVLTASSTSETFVLRWKNATTFVFQTAFPHGVEAFLSSLTDSNGNTTTLARGTSQQITQITDPVGRSLILTYDGFSRVTSIVDPIGRTVKYTYNNQGTLATVTDPAGGVTTYAYDSQNRMTDITDARQLLYLHNDYDANGRVIEQKAADGGITKFNYTLLNPNASVPMGFGGSSNTSQVLLTTVTDPLGNQTTYHYSPQGYLLDVTDALGEKTIYTLDPATNQVLSATDPLNRTTAFTYDAAGNFTTITRLAGTSNAVTTSFTYDPVSNKPTSITDPLKNQASMTYDGAGNLLTVTDPLKHQVIATYDTVGEMVSISDGASNKTQLAYTNGSLSSITDPLNNVTTLSSDAVGRLLSSTTPLGQTTVYSYDALNGVTQVIDPLGGTTLVARDPNGNLLSVTDPLGHITSYTYDLMDRRATRTDPLLRHESYQYDLAGNLIQFTDRRGNVMKYSYDALNRRTFAGFGASGTSFESTISYSYDSVNRIISVTDSLSGTTTDAYDELDRPVLETTPQGSISYGYDLASRRTSLTVAGQTPVSYAYDNAGHPTQIAQGTSSVGVSYDNANRAVAITLPNGVTLSYAYDKNSRVTGMTYTLGSATVGNLTYSYDQLGRRTQVGGSFARTNLPQAIGSTTYDAANELTNWNGTTISYDSGGNMLTDGTNSFIWNARNLVTAINGTGLQYDSVGRRIKNPAGTSFLYDGLNSVEEIAGNAPTASMLTFGTDDLFQRVDNNGTMAVVTDALGSVIALVDTSGRIATSYTYDPFGNTTTAGIASTNPSQFTGRDNDSNGLYYFRARYYSPVYGRFISEDPLDFESGDVNLYAYAGDSPTNWNDPLGMDWLDDTSDFIAGAGDSLTFGGTAFVRRWINGGDDPANHCSGAYKWGGYTETAAEIVLTLGSASLKSAAKEVGSEVARKEGRKYLAKIAAEEEGEVILHHANPLVGHPPVKGGPGNTPALFPTAGLPPWMHSGTLNVKVLRSEEEHAVEHLTSRLQEDIGKRLVNPATTSLRIVRLYLGGRKCH